MRRKFRISDHWHNIYFVLNAGIWAIFILILALTPVFHIRQVLILIGACSMASVVSSAILLRPRSFLAGVIIQVISWLALMIIALVIDPRLIKAVLIVFLPAAALSIGILFLLAWWATRSERALHRAMRRA